jgi:pantoate--beta-alanine ligase
MKIIRDIEEMRSFVKGQKAKGKTVGLVPTLGALHQGHVALLKKARKKTDVVVLSLFLNPIQFSEASDFKKYPRTLRKDVKLADACHVDVVFSPKEAVMYPDDFSTYITEEKFSKGLCGKSRPGHFRGVTTVVTKLFNIVRPDMAFFGQKDAQQTLVIQKMVRDLAWDVQIEVVPTVREISGLAYSSRNSLLTSKEREDALSLNEALFMAKVMMIGGERGPKKIIQKMKRIIQSRPSAKIDYIEIVNAATLTSIKTLSASSKSRQREKAKILVALAAWFGKVRLIDNIVIEV